MLAPLMLRLPSGCAHGSWATACARVSRPRALQPVTKRGREPEGRSSTVELWVSSRGRRQCTPPPQPGSAQALPHAIPARMVPRRPTMVMTAAPRAGAVTRGAIGTHCRSLAAGGLGNVATRRTAAGACCRATAIAARAHSGPSAAPPLQPPRGSSRPRSIRNGNLLVDRQPPNLSGRSARIGPSFISQRLWDSH